MPFGRRPQLTTPESGRATVATAHRAAAALRLHDRRRNWWLVDHLGRGSPNSVVEPMATPFFSVKGIAPQALDLRFARSSCRGCARVLEQ